MTVASRRGCFYYQTWNDLLILNDSLEGMLKEDLEANLCWHFRIYLQKLNTTTKNFIKSSLIPDIWNEESQKAKQECQSIIVFGKHISVSGKFLRIELYNLASLAYIDCRRIKYILRELHSRTCIEREAISLILCSFITRRVVWAGLTVMSKCANPVRQTAALQECPCGTVMALTRIICCSNCGYCFKLITHNRGSLERLWYQPWWNETFEP